MPERYAGEDEDVNDGDSIEAWLQQHEAAYREDDRAARTAYLAARGGKNDVQADRVRDPNHGPLQAVHLLQTDHNVAPVMGAVHMVRASGIAHDKHFMRDMHGDINEGQRVLKERSRRGPFRDQKGPSTVMDSSAHITYRKRSGVFEISVRRGVNNTELDQLLAKLSMHRITIHGSNVVVIKGNKKYRLGSLNRLDLRKLLRVIGDCLQNYGVCGIEITETTAGSGALYKSKVHGARQKSAARRRRGIHVI